MTRIGTQAASVLAGVLLAGSVQAGAPELDLGALAHDLAVVPGTDGAWIVVVGDGRTWIVEPDLSGVRAVAPVGGRAVVADGADSWLSCGSDGLSHGRLRAQGPRVDLRIDGACRGLRTLPSADGQRRVLVVGAEAAVWTLPDDGTPTARPVQTPPGDVPLLAVDGKRFALAARGGTTLVEEGPWGSSTLAAGGPIGGLTLGPSAWMWSLPREDALVDVTRARLPVAEAPGALAAGDLDGDGLRDVLVAHPEQQILGLIPGGAREEYTARAPLGVHRIAVGDLDADPCDEVVLLTADGHLQRLDRPCQAAPSTASSSPHAEPTPTPTPTPTPSAGGKFGAGSSSPPGDATALALGGAPPPTLEVRVGERLDLQLVDPIGQATAYAASGGPSGLVVTSSGSVTYRARASDAGTWRVQVRLWQDGSWARRASFEIVVRADESTAAAGHRVGRTTSDLALALDEEVGALERDLPIRSCLFGLGGVIGGSRGRSWVTLGEGFLISGSPTVSIGCGGGQRRLRWFAGFDMAPFFTYLVDETEYRHGIAATAALGYGDGDVFVGGYLTAGATLVGLGPVARWLPLEGPAGRRSGFEARVTWMPSDDLIIEGMLLYTIEVGSLPTAEGEAPEPRSP